MLWVPPGVGGRSWQYLALSTSGPWVLGRRMSIASAFSQPPSGTPRCSRLFL